MHGNRVRRAAARFDADQIEIRGVLLVVSRAAPEAALPRSVTWSMSMDQPPVSMRTCGESAGRGDRSIRLPGGGCGNGTFRCWETMFL